MPLVYQKGKKPLYFKSKGENKMKKMILSLTLIAILATLLCACGNNAPEATPPVQDPVPSVNEDSLPSNEDNTSENEDITPDNEDENTNDSKDSDLTNLEKSLLGQWLCIDCHEYCASVELLADKSATYDGTTYTWELISLDDGELRVDLNTISTGRYDPSYTAYTLELSVMNDGNYEGLLSKKYIGSICSYYRADDYKDYDVVELTSENIADYVEITVESIYAYQSQIYCNYSIQIKDGYGSISNCAGVINCRVEKRLITVKGENDYILGDVIDVYEDTLNYGNSISINGQYGSSFNTVLRNAEYDDETEETTGYVYFYEIIGSTEDNISGQIFVPKK